MLAQAIKVAHEGSVVPMLENYFPHGRAESEIQLFNLYGTVPERLSSDEDLAMWLLQTDQLNRTNVCQYFSSKRYDTLLRRSVLKKLASKICSLDSAKGFIEGLKFFLPVVGCWNPDPNETQASDAVMKYMLGEYVVAHLAHSDKPLFPNVVAENIPTLVEIALCILDLCKVLREGMKTPSTAMAEFFAALRSVLRNQQQQQGEDTLQQRQMQNSPSKQQRMLSISMKMMTDLYVTTTTGIPLTVLQLPESIPSYLFASVRLKGLLSVGYSLDNGSSSSFRPVVAYLMDDALYLFSLTSTTSTKNRDATVAKAALGAASMNNNGHQQQEQKNKSEEGPQQQPQQPPPQVGDFLSQWRLSHCIPLEAVRVRANENVSDVGLVVLCGLSESRIPVIEYSACTTSSSSTGMSDNTTSTRTSTVGGITYPAESQQQQQRQQQQAPNTSIVPSAIDYYSAIHLQVVPKRGTAAAAIGGRVSWVEQGQQQGACSMAYGDLTSTGNTTMHRYTNTNSSNRDRDQGGYEEGDDGPTGGMLTTNSITTSSRYDKASIDSAENKLRVVEAWIDALESSCWDCRAKLHSS